MKKKLFCMAAFALSAISLTAQVTIRSTRTDERRDYNEFVRTTNEVHPGGWNFDLLGVGMKVHPKNPLSKSYRYDRQFIMFSGWGFGFSNVVNAPANMELKMGRSFQFCISDAVSLRQRVWKHGSLNFGMGIDLRNYRMTNNRFLENERKEISISPFPEGSIPESSKLRIVSTTLNLKYIQNLGSGFRLALGPELSIVPKRAAGHKIVTRFTDENGAPHKEISKDIRTEKVGFNLFGALQYKNYLGVYTKYSFTNVLDKNFGPEFQPFSVGIMIMGI